MYERHRQAGQHQLRVRTQYNPGRGYARLVETPLGFRVITVIPKNAQAARLLPAGQQQRGWRWNGGQQGEVRNGRRPSRADEEYEVWDGRERPRGSQMNGGQQQRKNSSWQGGGNGGGKKQQQLLVPQIELDTHRKNLLDTRKEIARRKSSWQGGLAADNKNISAAEARRRLTAGSGGSRMSVSQTRRLSAAEARRRLSQGPAEQEASTVARRLSTAQMVAEGAARRPSSAQIGFAGGGGGVRGGAGVRRPSQMGGHVGGMWRGGQDRPSVSEPQKQWSTMMLGGGGAGGDPRRPTAWGGGRRPSKGPQTSPQTITTLAIGRAPSGGSLASAKSIEARPGHSKGKVYELRVDPPSSKQSSLPPAHGGATPASYRALAGSQDKAPPGGGAPSGPSHIKAPPPAPPSQLKHQDSSSSSAEVWDAVSGKMSDES